MQPKKIYSPEKCEEFALKSPHITCASVTSLIPKQSKVVGGGGRREEGEDGWLIIVTEIIHSNKDLLSWSLIHANIPESKIHAHISGSYTVIFLQRRSQFPDFLFFAIQFNWEIWKKFLLSKNGTSILHVTKKAKKACKIPIKGLC